MLIVEYRTQERITEPILKIYLYGSRVYKCHNELSDYDYIAVVDSDDDELYYSVNDETNNCNYTVYSHGKFIKRIKEHHISALECIFQQEEDPYRMYFELNYELLRREISAVSSNSYGKCRKKLRDGEYYIGKKSLFHSLRIIDVGIQIAEYGKIIDYSSSNDLLKKIMEIDSNDWSVFQKNFQHIFNERKSKFKILAPISKDRERKE